MQRKHCCAHCLTTSHYEGNFNYSVPKLSSIKGDRMAALDLKDVLGIAYKLNDWLNFYWNFYVVFSGVVIGWVFNSKGWPTAQRVIVTIFYSGFVIVSLGALIKTYVSLQAAADKLNTLLGTNEDLTSALVRQFRNDQWQTQIALHLLGDALVLSCIWLFTKKNLSEAQALK